MDPWQPPEGESKRQLDVVNHYLTAFQRTGAPTVFMWVEWCTLLALISYAQQKTGLWPLIALRWILGFLMWGYFINFFSEEFRWKKREEMFTKAAWLSWVLALFPALGMMGASTWLAKMFVEHPL